MCRIKTDAECKAILKSHQNEHNHLTDDRKLERQQVRVSVKRKATDISTRSAKRIRQYFTRDRRISSSAVSSQKYFSVSLYYVILNSPGRPQVKCAQT
jgi:hypothetical protein